MSMLRHTLIHELSHTFYMMLHGMTPSKFEIEYDSSGEYFGDCSAAPGIARKEDIIATLFAGPFGEIRSRMNGLRIDEPASSHQLRNLIDVSRPTVEVRFLGKDEPEHFLKGIFGTDWQMAYNQTRDVVARIPDFDVGEAMEICLSDAIQFVNEDLWWSRICLVSDELERRDDLRQLRIRQTVNIRDEVIALVTREIANIPKANPNESEGAAVADDGSEEQVSPTTTDK